jgi:hypothetical protein
MPAADDTTGAPAAVVASVTDVPPYTLDMPFVDESCTAPAAPVAMMETESPDEETSAGPADEASRDVVP